MSTTAETEQGMQKRAQQDARRVRALKPLVAAVGAVLGGVAISETVHDASTLSHDLSVQHHTDTSAIVDPSHSTTVVETGVPHTIQVDASGTVVNPSHTILLDTHTAESSTSPASTISRPHYEALPSTPPDDNPTARDAGTWRHDLDTIARLEGLHGEHPTASDFRNPNYVEYMWAHQSPDLLNSNQAHFLNPQTHQEMQPGQIYEGSNPQGTAGNLVGVVEGADIVINPQSGHQELVLHLGIIENGQPKTIDVTYGPSDSQYPFTITHQNGTPDVTNGGSRILISSDPVKVAEDINANYLGQHSVVFLASSNNQAGGILYDHRTETQEAIAYLSGSSSSAPSAIHDAGSASITPDRMPVAISFVFQAN